MGIFSKFGKTYQIGGSKTYKDAVSSVEYLARTAFGMLAEKPASEQTKIQRRVIELLGRLHKAIDGEVPLVATLTMLTALQALTKTMQKVADDMSVTR